MRDFSATVIPNVHSLQLKIVSFVKKVLIFLGIYTVAKWDVFHIGLTMFILTLFISGQFSADFV